MSKKISNTTKKKGGNKSFPIVAIGASAGGLEAVSELLKNLPNTTGMAFVYIQHLDPTHKSMLSAILGRVTKMKVVEARHRSKIEPNNIYIIPPNKDMTLTDGMLVLNARKAKPAVHMPIDKFFVSLAETQKEAVMGVILSGNASDGTIGLKAIKLAGGLTFAQDDTAKFLSMPKSAIAEGVVDLVLPPKEIASELVRISKQSETIQLVSGNEINENEISNRDEDLVNIIQLLRKSLGVDFTHYKMNTIKRRIIRRMLLYKLGSLKDYFKYLRQHTHEINVLYQDLLINVTSFFRDPDSLEYLRKTLLPRLLKNRSANNPFRVWIPACSTGEEAYSLAMVIIEVLGDRAASTAIQIFATDLSEIAIAKARLGLYSKNDVIDVSPKRLQRFFTRIDGSYRILKNIRDLCVFAPHNILKDPPFSRLDLISCCNLMIYLDLVLQKKVLDTFHYALNPNGYLILGKSETINTSTNLFSQLEKKYKIYSRKKDRNTVPVVDVKFPKPAIELQKRTVGKRVVTKEVTHELDLEKVVDDILLTQYVPSSVVVNKDLEILQFRGSTGLFLEPSPGKASLNLLKMARPGLPFELRNTVHKAGKVGHTIKKGGLEITSKGIVHTVSIEVTPLKTNTEERLFLIVFEETTTKPASEPKATFTKDKAIKKLQEELNAAKDDMRSIIEEQEASNEELQSANEEIVSSNEELQSINEELETSKEEVESTNEELMTINTELQVSNEQLAESYEYAEAVLGTIREAVLILDKDLRVKSANKSFYKTFRVRQEETEGVYIFDLGNGQWNIPKLRELLEDVIPQNVQFHGFEVTHVFPDIGEKVMVLNARRVIQKIHRQQLVLLAIEDITEHTQGRRIIAERESWIRNMANNVPVMIWVANTSKIFTFVNNTWLEYTGRKLKNENEWVDVIHPDDMESYLKIFHLSFAARKPFIVEYRLRRKDGEYRWIMDIGKPSFTMDGEFSGYLGSCTEIHDKRLVTAELEQKVEQRTHDLSEANKNLQNINSELEQFAYVASHDLQEPLRKIRSFADRLQQSGNELPEKMTGYVGKIWDASERMTRLIDDLLNFSRTSADTKPVKTDLNKVLSDVLVDFEEILAQKNARIISDKLPALPAIRIQITQLFHNLISNALKFAKEDRQTQITISHRILTKEEIRKHGTLDPRLPYTELTISDNGVGFSQKFAEQIFVIFQRAHSSKKFQGTGIGLALCRKIVNNHNGEIFAKSQENKGASFHVILPMQ